MQRFATFVASFVLLLAAPALALPSDVISGNPSVKAVNSHGQTVISFKGRAGKRLFRDLAGRHVGLICQSAQVDPTSPFMSADQDDFVMPKHVAKLRAILEGDWCEVLLVRKHHPMRSIVAVAITPAGTVFLDERQHAVQVDGLVRGATIEAGSGDYPATQEFLANHPGVIGLASPADPVPAGRYGFYSDGAQHIAVVGVSTAGKRLFEDVNGETVFTNVLGYVGSLNFG